MPSYRRYTLTEEETLYCIKIGKERNQKNQDAHVGNANFSGRDDDDISIQGVVGELAFARLAGISSAALDDTSCRTAASEVSFDGVLPNGKTVDVKCTIHDKADLRVTAWKINNPPDFYALLILENYARNESIKTEKPPTLSFRGMISSKFVFQEEYVQTIGNKNYFCIPQSDLVL